MKKSMKVLTGVCVLLVVGAGTFYHQQSNASESLLEPVSATLEAGDHSVPLSDDVIDTRTAAVTQAQGLAMEEALVSDKSGTCVMTSTADLEGGDSVLVRSTSWVRDHYCVMHNKAATVIGGLFDSDDEAVAATNQ